MLKKLSIAGLVLMASSSIAFADTSESMTAAGDDSSSSGAAMGDNTTATTTTTTTSTSTAHKKHKRHHAKKHHHKKCHHRHVSSSAEPDAVVASAPSGDYKGEVSPCAPAACVPPPFVVGPYVGFDVGSRVNYTNKRAIYTGAEGTLFGGYSMLWDQWFGAIEINVADSAEINNYTSPTFGSAKSTWSYGLSVLPGYMITDDVLGYLRIGVERTRFSTHSSNVTGGQLGLGLETQLCNNWDLRGEYVYDFYNSISSGGGNPKTQQFNLGIVYKFKM